MSKNREPELLDTEVQYLQENHRSLRQKYPGKVLLIKGNEVLGAYDSEEEAALAGVELFPEPGARFLVRSVNRIEDPKIGNPALVLGIPLSCPS
ncbi:MAG: hypothetical protein F4107_12290 [Gemmatimonadetes bacterium]|nr:hypothetical protein [Gemmatimonadota bacterium]MYD13386.1 hypothetical protein [Gemmatimonadota bacterium]MYI66691.1 hypothetical protein [Gemmatimonadota bacterium]